MHPQRFNTDHHQVVLRAWQDQLTEASPHSSLEQTLVQRQRELLPRFADHYRKLVALPRRTRRRLRREWKRSLAGIALLLALGQAPALAATINVGGGCNLVDAITAANTNNAIGGCTAGRGADKILLPTDRTQRLTRAIDTPHGPTGLPLITSKITIEGLVRGAAIERNQGAPEFRILTIAGSGDLTLERTRVSGGQLTNPRAGLRDAGGGILNHGALTLSYSTVSGNLARGGGGVATRGNTAAIYNSTISGNSTSGNDARGGGVFNNGPMSIKNSTISGNSTSGRNSDGGGVFNRSGPLTVNFSTLTGNSTSGTNSRGGGVFNDAGTLTLVGTIVSGNTALLNTNAGQEIYSRTAVMANGFNLFGHRGLTTVQALYNVTPADTDITATQDSKTPYRLVRILDTTLRFNGGPTQTHCVNGSGANADYCPNARSDSPASPAYAAIDDPNSDAPPSICPERDQRSDLRSKHFDPGTSDTCTIGAFEKEEVPDFAFECAGRVAFTTGTDTSDPSLRASGGGDTIQARRGSDIVMALGGADLACGGSGNDGVLGGLGNDELRGDGPGDSGGEGPPGNDTLLGGPGSDTLFGGPGRDTCDGGMGTDTAPGESCEVKINIP